MVESGRLGPGLYAEDNWGGGTRGGGVGDGRDSDRDERLIKWKDTVANVNLWTEPNDLLSYATGLELHHPIMSKLGRHRDLLERERVLYFG